MAIVALAAATIVLGFSLHFQGFFARRLPEGLAARRSEFPETGVPLPAKRGVRPVYPYSVIAGGAYSPAEFVTAEAADEVVARHFAQFRTAELRFVRSPFTRPVYVSYRKGQTVYWTRRPVQLHKDEPLLTDGNHYARARCGNRISEEPQLPVAAVEPPPAVLEAPLPPEEVADVPAAPKPAELPEMPQVLTAPATVVRRSSSVERELAPTNNNSSNVFVRSGGEGRVPKTTPPVASTPTVNVPVVLPTILTPEPSPFVFFLSGLVVMGGVKLWRNRSQRP